MRIHSNTLTVRDLQDASMFARVEFERLDLCGSRKRDHAFDIKLSGHSRRRPNDRGEGAANNVYAATWDQWGVFLAFLYERDEDMLTPYYADATDFAFQTADRFGAPETVMGSDGYTDVFKSYGWPEDDHGDHVFRWAGRPRESACTRCSAKRRWADHQRVTV